MPEYKYRRHIMAVKIKTIPNDLEGVDKDAPSNHTHAHHNKKAMQETSHTNKIWELEWEALGKKLNKTISSGSGAELDKLRKQLKEKDQQLQDAQRRVSDLKKQLHTLEEQRHGSKPSPHQNANNPRRHEGGDKKKNIDQVARIISGDAKPMKPQHHGNQNASKKPSQPQAGNRPQQRQPQQQQRPQQRRR